MGTTGDGFPHGVTVMQNGDYFSWHRRETAIMRERRALSEGALMFHMGEASITDALRRIEDADAGSEFSEWLGEQRYQLGRGLGALCNLRRELDFPYSWGGKHHGNGRV